MNKDAIHRNALAAIRTVLECTPRAAPAELNEATLLVLNSICRIHLEQGGAVRVRGLGPGLRDMPDRADYPPGRPPGLGPSRCVDGRRRGGLPEPPPVPDQYENDQRVREDNP